jgi:hypothetical protein
MSHQDEILEQEYLKWLLEYYKLDTLKSFIFLLRRLWKKEFYSAVEMDVNRAADGVYLRYIYCEHNGIEYDWLNDVVGNCRVLEMLIALAKSAMMSVSVEKTGLTLSKFFWEMLDNLGLSIFRDEYVKEHPDPVCAIDDILLQFLDRKYSFNGKGGLFPLKSATKNQRLLEISAQLNEFIAENELF